MDLDEEKQTALRHPVVRFATVLGTGFIAGVGVMSWLQSYSGMTMMFKKEERELRGDLKKVTDQVQSLSQKNAELQQTMSETTTKLQLCQTQEKPIAVCPPSTASASPIKEGSATEATTAPATQGSAPTLADAIVGQWQGRYTYSDGVAGMTLTVKQDPKEGLVGDVRFYPVAENLRALSGHYVAAVTVNETTGVVSFEGNRWVIQQIRYRFVPMDGTLSSDRTTFEGIVNRDNRYKFKLRKQ